MRDGRGCAAALSVGVRRLQELEVWQLANRLHLAIVRISATPRAQRDFRFFDQFLGASRSVPANIAEGFGRFRVKEFRQFLDYARGSIAEVQVHLIEAEARALVGPTTAAELRILTARIAAALTALIKSLPSKPAPRS